MKIKNKNIVLIKLENSYILNYHKIVFFKFYSDLLDIIKIYYTSYDVWTNAIESYNFVNNHDYSII